MEKPFGRQMQRKVSGGAFVKLTFASLRQLQLPAGDAEAEGRKRVREAPASCSRTALHGDSLLVSREYSLQAKSREVRERGEKERRRVKRGHGRSFVDVH